MDHDQATHRNYFPCTFPADTPCTVCAKVLGVLKARLNSQIQTLRARTHPSPMLGIGVIPEPDDSLEDIEDLMGFFENSDDEIMLDME